MLQDFRRAKNGGEQGAHGAHALPVRVYIQKCFDHANTVSIIQPSVQHDMRGVAYCSNTFTNYSMVEMVNSMVQPGGGHAPSSPLPCRLRCTLHNGLHKLLVHRLCGAGGSSWHTHTPKTVRPGLDLRCQTMCCLPLDLVLRNRSRVLVVTGPRGH